MLKNIVDYTLTEKDFIEAEQISIRNSDSFWSNLVSSILLAGLSFIEIKRISDPKFFVSELVKKNMQIQTVEEHIISFLLTFLVSILLIGQNLPKYNPLSRWNISGKYKKDFIRQETKTIEINETGITRKSDNYYESRQWSGYSKFVESRNIFLLFGEGDNTIIPKRAFTTEEQLDLFQTMLNNKIKHK